MKNDKYAFKRLSLDNLKVREKKITEDLVILHEIMTLPQLTPQKDIK
jgi:hypothetical protein